MTKHEAKLARRQLALVARRLADNQATQTSLLAERGRLLAALWHECDKEELARLAGITVRRLYQLGIQPARG